MKKALCLMCCCICPVAAALIAATPALPRAAQEDAAPQVYTLQLMALPDKSSAARELQKLLAQGYEAYIAEYTTQAGKIIYKLRTGSFSSRNDAEAAALEYAAREGESALIVTTTERDEPRSGGAAPEAAADKVRVTVPDAAGTAGRTGLEEKVRALRRGDPPPLKKAHRRSRDDETWFTVETSTELDRRTAERRVNQLRDRGYDAYCTEVVQNGRRLFKIRFGDFKSSRLAQRASKKYRTMERRSSTVIKIVNGIDAPEADPPRAAAKTQPRAAALDGPDQPAAAAQEQPAQDPDEQPDDDAKPGPADIDRLAGADLPSEPEPLIGPDAGLEDQPEQAPAEDTIAAQDEATPQEPAQPSPAGAQEQPLPQEAGPVTAVTGPERLTSIYAYRKKSGAMNLTNRYDDIPEELRKNIDHIALFPGRIRNIAQNSGRITLDFPGERKDIVLAGLKLPKISGPALAYLEALGETPLRLRYSPWLTAKNGAFAGRLYLKEGAYINLDMVRKGLCRFDPETLEPDQQDAFRQAQDAAKRDHAGIWQ